MCLPGSGPAASFPALPEQRRTCRPQVGGHSQGDPGPHRERGEEPLERHAAAQGLRGAGKPLWTVSQQRQCQVCVPLLSIRLGR